MGKSKGKSSRKKGGQVEEVVQCPHLHFKADVIDRNVLSKEQHLNLLSTPKGYRWEEYKKEGGDGGPAEELSAPRRITCSGRRMKKAERVYVHNFLAEVWNLLTPEMVDRLKGMLMNEFGMSPQEADDFICKQREENIVNSSTVSFYKKPRDIGDGKFVYDHVVKMRNPNKAQCDKFPKSNLGIRNSWIKDFSDFLSDMMSSYVLDTICTERNDRQQEIAQTLLNRFNTLLEQKASMSDPKTPTDKTLVLVADRLATWLDSNVGASKEAAQQMKIAEKAQQRKKLEEERKRRHEEMKKRREAEENAQKLADEQAQKLADEQAQKLSKEEQDKKMSGKEKAEGEKDQKAAEGEEKEKSPGGPKELTPGAVEQKEEVDTQKAEEEQPKKGIGEAATEEAKPEIEQGKEQGEQEKKEKEEEAAAVAAEQQKALNELKQKEEDEKAKEEAEKQKAEEEQKKAEQEAAESEKQKAEEDLKKAESEAAEAEKQKAEEEQQRAAQEAAVAEKQKAEEEQKKAEQEAAEAEKQKAEEDLKKAESEAAEAEKQKAEEELQRAAREAVTAATEIAKQEAEDEQKKKEEAAESVKGGSEEPVDEKPRAGPSEQPLEPSELPVEDITPSETTESEPPVSDIEEEPVPAPPTEKPDEVEPITEVEEKPVDTITPADQQPIDGKLSPKEKELRTNEVLQSVASIILETKVDPSPRQEALKDIMGKHLEENLGDQDKEAIDKVSSKIGTWIDKMVDQATLEYGTRESIRQAPAPEDIWAPASSRAQPPILGPGGPVDSKAPTEPGWVPGATGAPSQPGWGPGVTGTSSQPGWGPGVSGAPSQPGWVPGFGKIPQESGWVSGVSGTQVPVAQRPKGSIYHLSKTDSGFDVTMISNTRAQGKIRLARGKSPAYDNVPNPDAAMEPTDLKSWYKWTSALTDVAESWADWIKDTIKGTQQKGEEMLRDSSPQRLSEWREFRDSRAQSARKWQQTKKDMEQRAELWSRKQRIVQSK